MTNPRTSADSVSTRRAAAEAWLKTAVWHLAVMRGTRVLPAVPGEEDAPPAVRTVMRIFAKGCPAPAMRDVLHLLGVNDTLTDPIIDGVVCAGTWKHKYAYWNRDSGMSENGDSTKTLIRDFYDGASSLYAAVEDGCGSRTSIRYVFDATEVETLGDVDHAGDQGYSVRIGGVSRDRESDTFSYFVTTTERKTQYLPEHMTGDDAFSTDYSEDWMGLRGTVSSPTDDAGASVDVIEPEDGGDGETINVQWDRNLEDCTLNARGRRKVAKPDVTAGVSCAKDTFGEQHSESVSGAAEGVTHAPAAAAGVITELSAKLRPDGLFDKVTAVKTEYSVPGAQVSEEKTVFSLKTRRTDKASAETRPETSAAAGVGVSASESVTPGGRRDIVTETSLETAYPQAQVSEQKTIYDEVTRSTDVHSLAAVPEASVAAGVLVEVTADVQPLGSKNITTVTKRELPVDSARASEHKSVMETRVSETDRSMSVVPALPAFGAGVTVGQTAEKTPGGLFDVTLETVTENPIPGIRKSERDTAFETDESVTDRGDNDNVEVPEAADGVIKSKSVSMTSSGLFDLTDGTLTEKYVPEARVTLKKTPWFTRRTVFTRSSSDGSQIPPAGFGELSVEVTPGNLFNRTVSDITDIDEGASIGSERGGDAFSSYITDRTIVGAVAYSADVGLKNNGTRLATIVTEKFDRDPDGYYTKTRTVETVGPKIWLEKSDRFTDDEGTQWSLWHYQFRNATQAEVFTIIARYTGKSSLLLHYGVSVNRFELYDGGFDFKYAEEAEA